MKYSIEAWIYDPIAKEILLLKVKTENVLSATDYWWY